MGRSVRRGHPAQFAALAIGAALVVTLLPAPARGAASQFGAYQAIALPSDADAVAIGDVTGDGRADVVVSTWYANNPAADFHIFVFAQTETGTLAAPVSYATAGAYSDAVDSIAIGDLTGDGLADVAVGLSGGGIQVFPQDAAGTLGTPTLTPTADSLKIAFGHLDDDADLDVAGLGWGTDTVTVFSNDGTGALDGGTVYPALHGGYDDLSVGDVSGDGRDDLVVMSGQSILPNISVLVQLPEGTFSPASEYSVGDRILTHGIGLGDVTGDGRTDVVASYGGNRPASHIGVFAQTASGTLAPSVAYASYDIPEPVEVADVDNDGRADVVTVHGGWNRVGVYRSLADGTLAPEELYSIPYASHYNPHGLAVGDITGDGWADLAIADYNYGLVILRNTGEVAPPTQPPTPTPTATPTPTPTPAPIPPGAPRSLATSPNLAAGVGLSWDAPSSEGSSPVTGYRIYRGTSSGGATLLVTVGAVLSFTDTAVANGATYWYQVSAVSAAGEGPRSAEVVAERGTAPGAPGGVSAKAAKAGVTVAWQAPATNGGSPVTGYRVYRRTTTGTPVFVASVGSGTTAFTDTTVARRTRYAYSVSAVNALGEGARSAEVTVTSK
jgi:hypothetical protein